MPFCICCAPVVLGATCRAINFRRARRFTTSFASSSATTSGRRSGPSCTWPCASGWAAGPAHRRRFSTASRSSQPKGAVETTRWVATPTKRSRVVRSTPWSTPKSCRCGSSSTPPRRRGLARQDTLRFPWLALIWADSGYNAWHVDAAVARCRGCGRRSSGGTTT
jgi:hypothetical protein